MCWYLSGMRPLELLSGLREALVVAFTTSSSAATLPVSQRCCEENLGVPRSIASFVLPLGATLNSDGTALYEAIAAIFVSSLYGIDLGLGGQLVVVIVSIATAIGAPDIPSAGMVTMIVVLEAGGAARRGGRATAHDRPLPRHLPHRRERRGRCNRRGDRRASGAGRLRRPRSHRGVEQQGRLCLAQLGHPHLLHLREASAKRGGTGSPESIFMRSGST